jgi:hypothetical protein
MAVVEVVADRLKMAGSIDGPDVEAIWANRQSKRKPPSYERGD